MQVLKDRKAKLEERRERKEALKESFQAAHEAVDEIKAINEGPNKGWGKDKEVDFEDDQTQAKFGDVVTVTTTFGIPEEDENSDSDEERKRQEWAKKEKQGKQQITKQDDESSIVRGKKGQGVDWEQRKANSLQSALKKVEKRLNQPKKKTKANKGWEKKNKKFVKALDAKHLSSKAMMLSRQKK
mmetsp:Transcript_52321/g.90017  ORF Transcript_52321/g.90017 Transcript_52321/m.90017 type:complete len:185 (-) Transcript_52321:206-760(-)